MRKVTLTPSATFFANHTHKFAINTACFAKHTEHCGAQKIPEMGLKTNSTIRQKSPLLSVACSYCRVDFKSIGRHAALQRET